MERSIELWTVEQLQQKYGQIHFPEYQRDPNVWSRDAKQRLIDSMMREFDIAPLYFYTRENDVIDCVDGRQRIGAIMSFLGINERDSHKGFEFRELNELYDEDANPFRELDRSSFSEIALKAEEEGEGVAANFVRKLLQYQLTVVSLSQSHKHNEFNLQFARLNLGVIINSGEKLNAMVGDLRDICFDDLGQHGFLQVVSIPERRFAREQTAAQILAQVFGCESNRRLDGSVEYARTRNVDLQRMFKRYTDMTEEERLWVERVKALLSLLESARDHFVIIRSRAFLVSVVLLAYLRNLAVEDEAAALGAFVQEFSLRLKWQVRKGLDVDQEYRYLVDFQRDVTQASGEKPAVAGRAKVLEDEFSRWQEVGELRGDREYEERQGEAAGDACRRVLGA